jgi:predicted nuclease with TOPRIM domain
MTAHGPLTLVLASGRVLSLAVSVAFLACWMSCQPRAYAGEAGEQAADEVLDEVEVRARRARIDELRREVTRLEDRIYARYNDLNRIDRFDIVCSEEARTGTRIERRYCRPKFEYQAKVEEGQVAFLSIQQRSDHDAPVAAASVQLPDSPVNKILQQVPQFQRHMRRIMEEDRQLQDLMEERADAAERLERARSELFAR